jgi:hypothetical protein
MTPRGTINFFRHSRTGTFLVFLVLLGIGYILYVRFKPPTKTAAIAPERPETQKPQVVETVKRDMTAFNPPKEVAPKVTPPPTPAPAKPQSKAPELPPISLFADSPSTEQAGDQLSDDYAPFGRLIRCELIVTVDSSSINTPIVGLTTDDIWHNGRLIVPAGTEVHGSAKVDRVRERIASSGGWTLVWQTGEELRLSGIALDREKEQDGEGWGITDGSAGLRGQLIKSDDLAEIKLFAATFLSGAAASFTEQEQTLFGSRAMPSLQNAPLVGAQQVLNTYAKQILDTIQRDGFYVRVPAGKQFYLYATQTIDKSKAVIGGTRFAKVVEDEPKDVDPIDQLRRQLIRRASQNAAQPAPSATGAAPTTAPR